MRATIHLHYINRRFDHKPRPTSFPEYLPTLKQLGYLWLLAAQKRRKLGRLPLTRHEATQRIQQLKGSS